MAKTLYPRADVDPRKKRTKEYLMQYAEAALEECRTACQNIFYGAAEKYQELRDYALGKHSTDKYKPILGVDEGSDESWALVDWSALPIVSKFRDIAISILEQRRFMITATPIDPLATDEADKYYTEAKVKLLQIEAAKASGDPALINSPALKLGPGDPEDLEELEMHMAYSFKFNFAMEAEEGIELVFYQSDINTLRRIELENSFDFGVSGYKDEIDANGMPTVRHLYPGNIVTNFCRKKDFTDAIHVGEVIEVPLHKLAGILDDATLKYVAEKLQGQYENPRYLNQNTEYNRGFEGFKAQVLDLEIIMDDEVVYEKRVDRRGNLHVGKADYKYKDSDAMIAYKGKEESKYKTKKISNVYKIKWIIGTDVAYDYGLACDMKREPTKKLFPHTSLSYHLYAYNFDNMRSQSMMERLKPSVDEYHLTHYKLQNLKNQMITAGWAIDLDALESVSLTKGGEDMDPESVLNMFFQRGILVYRGSTIDNTNPNRKPIEALMNSYANDLTALWNDLKRIVQDMRDMIGLNELTDSSTPSDRMLNGVANMATAATNNALYPLIAADKNLLERLAKGVIQRLQIAVKNGNVEGIVKALGEGTVKHIRVSDAIAPHVWGIMIQDKPTDQERDMLIQQLNLKDANGQVDPELLVTVYAMNNLKQARQYVAYKTKKLKKEAEAAAQQQIALNAQAQDASNEKAEERKRETLAFEYKLKTEFMVREQEELRKTKAMELESKERQVQHQTEAAVVKQDMSNEVAERNARRSQGEVIPEEGADDGSFLMDGSEEIPEGEDPNMMETPDQEAAE